MGYYTDFSLVVTGNTSDEEVAQYLTEISDYAFDNLLELYEVKWYDWEDDMKKLSMKFPRDLFTLSGEGEDSGDLWVAYFRGGKMQFEKAVISYGKFDKKKLV